MRRWLPALILLGVLGVGSCGVPPQPIPEGPSAGVALRLDLPRGLLLEAQAAITAGTRIELEIQLNDADGALVGCPTATPVVRLRPSDCRLVPIEAGRTELGNVPPGRGYRLDVYAGFRGDGEKLGIVRYEGHALVDVPPNEMVVAEVALRVCERDADLPNCNESFGVAREPPAPPELFPLPERTGCDGFTIAGTKPTGTVVLDTAARQLVATTGPVWSATLGADYRPGSGNRYSVQLSTAWADDLQTTSRSPASVELPYDPIGLCFDPYGAAPHLEYAGGTWTARWDPGGRSGSLIAVVTPPDPGWAPAPATVAVPADAYQVVTTPVDVGSLTFADPGTTAWELTLFVPLGGGWSQEGRFRYHEGWAANFRTDWP